MSAGVQFTNLVDKKEFINGAEIIRGACSLNARDPNVPEFGKYLKIENVSWLGRGSNLSTPNFQNFDSNVRKVRKKLTRNDF